MGYMREKYKTVTTALITWVDNSQTEIGPSSEYDFIELIKAVITVDPSRRVKDITFAEGKEEVEYITAEES